MKTELSVRIGHRLLKARTELGLKQRDVAERMGYDPPLDPQRVSDWERGESTPNERNMLALARALEKSVAWFYAQDEPETKETPDLMGKLEPATDLSVVLDRLNAIDAKIDDLSERVSGLDAADSITRIRREFQALLGAPQEEPPLPDTDEPADDPRGDAPTPPPRTRRGR